MRLRTAQLRRRLRPGTRLRQAVITLVSAAALVTSAGTAAMASPAASSASHFKHACATPAQSSKKMHCHAIINTAVPQQTAAQLKAKAAASPAAASPTGISPANLQSAYNLASAAASKGAGETVVIVDVYDYTTAQSDLNAYRSQYGLPACGSGCFKKVNENGATSPLPSSAGTSGWDVEEALDIDMVSAICPLCNITLVEANSASDSDLYTAENTAAGLGKFVSNSWGGSEYSGEQTDANSYFNHPGVAITVSAGDSPGPEFPAEAQYVTAVGGTTLNTSSSTRGWTESPWSDSGGGCSSSSTAPSWQTSSVTGCSKREDNDVSADADPNTGAAIYNTESESGWLQVGGTSESAPIIAAVYALAGTPASGTYPSQYPWSSEPNGLYHVGSGTAYASVPGWGTPNGTTAFTSGSGGGGTGNTVTVTNPGSQTGTVGTAVSKQITATDSAGGSLTYTASGLPAGLSISSSGLISGTPTTAGTYNTTVTAKDSTGASGSTAFTWTISSSGGGGTGCTTAQVLGNPGFETGSASPWSMSSGVLNNDTASEPAHAGSWDAWLDGYGTTHTDTVSQTVTLPSGCSTYKAGFYLHVDTDESTASTQYDTLKVQVLNSSGTVLSTLATFSNLNHASGYTSHSYSLASYAGQTVTLKFTGSEDSSLQTSFVLDDTSINVG